MDPDHHKHGLIKPHCTAVASGEAQTRHPLTDIPPEAPGIEHKFWFPEHYSLAFPAGDVVRP